MNTFKTGDFVRLKDPERWVNHCILNKDVNIFEIRDITGSDVTLHQIVETVTLQDIEPIPIDGVADKSIYYQLSTAAHAVAAGMTGRIKSHDYMYYYEVLGKWQDEYGVTFQQLIKDAGYTFVHEVQAFLYDLCKENPLRIKAN